MDAGIVSGITKQEKTETKASQFARLFSFPVSSLQINTSFKCLTVKFPGANRKHTFAIVRIEQ